MALPAPFEKVSNCIALVSVVESDLSRMSVPKGFTVGFTQPEDPLQVIFICLRAYDVDAVQRPGYPASKCSIHSMKTSFNLPFVVAYSSRGLAFSTVATTRDKGYMTRLSCKLHAHQFSFRPIFLRSIFLSLSHDALQ